MALKKAFLNYMNEFIRLFSITGNGTIKADTLTLSQIRQWIEMEDVSFIILSTTGLGLKG